MNAWTDAIVPWLADFYLLASVLMLGVLLAMRWIRQPVQRVALGWAVMGTTLALAAVSAMPFWPRFHLVSARHVESSVPMAAPPHGLEPMAHGGGSEAVLGPPLAIPPRRSAGQAARDDMRELEPGPVVEPIPAFVAQRSSRAWSDARPWLAGAFLTGSALAALWLALGAVEAMWLCRKAVAAPASLQDRLREIVGPQPRPPRLLLSRHVGNAVALGVLRPTILLPPGLADETDGRGVGAVLAHEWAHVRNRDLRLLALVRSLLVVLFPHPLYWWLRHTIRTSQESLADAVAAAGRQADYAQDLVAWMRRIAGHDRVRIAAAVGIWEGPSQLSRRIAMLVDDSFCVQLRSSRSWKCCAWACVGLLALGLSSLTLRPMPPLVAAEALLPSAPSAAKHGPERSDSKTNAPPALPTDPKAPAQLPAPLAYTGVVKDYVTGLPIEGATVNVRRQILTATEHKTLLETRHTTDKQGKYTFTIPPKQVADDYLYIELDALHPDYVSRMHFGYALSMIRKNENLGQPPFFDTLYLGPTVALSGTVVEPSGALAAGMKVFAYSSPTRDKLWGAQFQKTTTDGRGKFRLNVHPTGTVLVWLMPERFAPSMHVIDMTFADLGRYVSSLVTRQLAPSGQGGERKGRDLGRFALEEGITLRGRVIDLKGKPVTGVWVEADLVGGPAKKPHSLGVGDTIHRAAVTSEMGEFTLNPLSPSDYTIHVRDEHYDWLIEDHTLRPLPTVFVSQSVSLAAGKAPPAIEFRAVPEAVVEVRYVDSAGKPSYGHESFLGGKVAGSYFSIRVRPDDNGVIVAKVPKGLTGATMDLITNEHTALRHRVSKNGPLSNTRQIRLGTVDRDMREVTVIRYEAPILIVKAISEDGRPIYGFRIQGRYPDWRGPLGHGPFVLDGQPSDIYFYGRADGGWQSSQLLPDEPLILTVQAPGYQPATEKLSLPEGAVKELAVKLKKR